MKSLKASSQNPVLYLRLRLCYKGFENTGLGCRLARFRFAGEKQKKPSGGLTIQRA